MSSDVLFQSFPKQDEFIEACFSGKYKFLLYGGAIRGGKSFVSISIANMLCKIFPGSRGAIVRKDLPTLKRNTIPTFNKIKPKPFFGEIKKDDWICKAANGSEIIFFTESIKDDPDLNRWKGLELNWIVFEEANEMQEKTFWKGVERTGTWFIKGLEVQPPILIILTCNPSQNWVKTLFYEPWAAGQLKAPFYFLQATAEDNPHISKELKESWESMPEAEYRRFVKGDWNVTDDPKQLIKWEWVKECESIIEESSNDFSMGIDVAREGDDRTVFLIMKGENLFKIIAWDKNKITDIYTTGAQLMLEYGIQASKVGVDSVGMGAGVVDMFHENGMYVNAISAGSAPENWNETILQPYNLKAQMFWDAKERIRKAEIGGLSDIRLQSDLTVIWFFTANDKKFRIESKEDLKKRIGRSPDYAEAFVICNWVRTHSSTFEPVSVINYR